MLLVQYQRAKQLGKAIGQELVDSISFLFHLQILDFGISSLLPLGTLDEHSLSLSLCLRLVYHSAVKEETYT